MIELPWPTILGIVFVSIGVGIITGMQIQDRINKDQIESLRSLNETNNEWREAVQGYRSALKGVVRTTQAHCAAVHMDCRQGEGAE